MIQLPQTACGGAGGVYTQGIPTPSSHNPIRRQSRHASQGQQPKVPHRLLTCSRIPRLPPDAAGRQQRLPRCGCGCPRQEPTPNQPGSTCLTLCKKIQNAKPSPDGSPEHVHQMADAASRKQSRYYIVSPATTTWEAPFAGILLG
jgi:hypothetical protein